MLERVYELVGLPYKSGGTSRSEGFDCLTLCAEVYRIIGRSFYCVDPHPPQVKMSPAIYLDWAKNWRSTTPQPWVVVQTIPIDGVPHCGVLLPDGRVIHADSRRGVITQRHEVMKRIILSYWEPVS